jgi:hypothetical protein
LVSNGPQTDRSQAVPLADSPNVLSLAMRTSLIAVVVAAFIAVADGFPSAENAVGTDIAEEVSLLDQEDALLALDAQSALSTLQEDTPRIKCKFELNQQEFDREYVVLGLSAHSI